MVKVMKVERISQFLIVNCSFTAAAAVVYMAVKQQKIEISN
jgi:hypothetical protein